MKIYPYLSDRLENKRNTRKIFRNVQFAESMGQLWLAESVEMAAYGKFQNTACPQRKRDIWSAMWRLNQAWSCLNVFF